MAEDPNIFDSASGRSKESKEPVSKQSPKEPPPTDEEVEKMLERIDTLHRKIERELEEVYATQGLNYTTVNEYLDNPSNFSEKDWALLEERRQEVKKKLEGDFKESVGVQKRKLTKKRPRKMRGGRRDWLQMD